MTKDEMRAEHEAEFNARWKLKQLDDRIVVLQKERDKAYHAWTQAKDKTRLLKRLNIVPLEDSQELVTPVKK